MLLSIDGACCDGASSVVRSQLASEISHETAKCERARQTDDSREKAANLDGGRIIFRFWTPPSGWVPPSPARVVTETAADAVAATVEALPEWREEQMKCVIRLCVRLSDWWEQGQTKPHRDVSGTIVASEWFGYGPTTTTRECAS